MRMRRFAAGMALLWLTSVAAPGANVLQTFFMPLPEDDMQISLNAIDAYRGLIGDEMQAAISMVIGTDNTTLYYDHWEDGYEEDITNPTQLTSQIWGDGYPDNGFPPGFPDDLLEAGDVVRLESTIDVTRNSVTIEYDGRDKVATTYPIAMTRAMYAVNPGEVLAEAMGVFDIGTHGTRYRAPVGVGTGTGFGTNTMFSYSSFYIMADYDFTRIDLDRDNDGIFEETQYLDQGEPWFVNGNVLAGATVQGSQPFQCHLVTGDVGSTYEMRWFELWPESQWGTDYFTPVASRTSGGTTYPSLVYLFNPNAETITVSYVTSTNSGSFTVNPNSVYDVFRMPVDAGARFYTTNGAPFLGVNAFDTSVGGGTLYGFVQHCQTFDWGIGLMPVNMMSTMGVVGWGPGYGTTAAGTNGSPIWVAAATNTTIYVDYDSDPDTGALVDPQGNRYDYSTNVVALQSVRLADMNDEDQTGLRFYTVDGTVLMGAWGEDPAWAQPGNPYLDMGYAIPAFPTIISKKFASLLTDVNTNGYADSGDTIEYFVDIVNVGFATANNVIFQDDLPTNLTAYVTNTALVASGGATNAAPDSLPPKLTRFPFDEGGYNVGTVSLGQTSTVRYVTQVLTDLPAGFDGYIHNNATVGGTNGNWTGGSTIPVRVGGLSIEKQTSTTNLLEPGTNFAYAVTVANTGTVTYTGVNIADALPLGVTYVPGSAQIQISGSITNLVADRFDERAYTNQNGNIPWLTGWQEGGESDGVAAGGVQAKADGTNTVPLEAYALMIGNASRSATRQADLSGHAGATLSFNYRRSGLDGATDFVQVYISSNNWASSNLLVQLAGAADDTNRTAASFNVTAYIATNTGVRFLSSSTMGAADFVWFDNVTFALTGSNATFAGTAPPTLAENITLPPGSSVTATFAVTVDNPPVTTQAVNQARVRADQEQSWIDSNPVTNRINATAGLTLQKATSTTNLLVAGTNVDYTILISNTGTVAQTGILLEDLLPFGMTYSNGTARLFRPFVHTNVFLDLFDAQAYGNSDGNVAWAGDWTEIGDDNVATNGNVRIAVDGTSIPGQTYALRTVSTSVVQRAANLGGYTNATLQVDYRRVTLDAGDVVNLNVSSNNGATFTQVGQIGGATNDGSYFSASFNISAYASTGTVIRFGGNASRDATDIVWLDNIRIAVSAANATNALPSPPALLENYSLPPGTNMTVTLTATVDDPITATSFINTARLLSDQQTTWITSRVTNAASGAIGMKLSKWTALATNWDYGVTNDYYITVENTGSVTLVGLKLTDVLPAGVTFVPDSVDLVQFLSVTTNAFSETVSDGFGTASYGNNDGSNDWVGAWNEIGDNASAANGSVLVRTAGGTNALVFELTNADNDFVTRTNQLATVPGRIYTNMTLSFSYRREAWDNTDFMTFTISTNGFGGQSNQVYRIDSRVGNDAAYTNVTTNLTAFIGSRTSVALRVRAGQNFGAGDRINFDFITFTNSGYEISTNATPDYSSAATVVVVSNLTSNPTNLLANYSLAPGTSVSVRVRATLNVPLAATQFVNTATATNAQTPPASATATNFSVANSVGDFVWHDVGGDGVQSGVEPGITGVVVRIYDSGSNLLATTTSGVAGAYAFTNLPTGSYFLEFVTPPDFLATVQDFGGDDALDSDISTNTGRTVAFSLSGGTNDTSRDAGFYQPVSSIGNFIWRDVNGNGVQNGGAETGMPGVVVRLYDASSNVVGVTTSSAAGAYSFANLEAGNYFVGFTAPTNFTFTLQDQGADDTLDSDVSPATGRTPLFYLPPGTADTRWDAGLSAVVYGLRLTKTSNAGACLAASNTITYTMVVQNTGTVTQAGIVLQDPLPSGLAYVTGSVTWAGGTLATAGPPPNLLVNLTLTNNQSATVTVQAVVSSPSSATQLLNTASTYSAVQPAIFASVTNCVQFADVGVRKTVTTNSPDMVQIIEYMLVATNSGPNAATGMQITDVVPAQVQYNSHSNGTYNAGTGVWDIGTLAAYASTTLYINVTVRENTAGLQITNAAAITGRDLYDPVPTNDASAVVIVPKGGATVGDRVWFDANANGIQDSGETQNITNLPVSLMTTNGVVVTSTVTSAQGLYRFENIVPGSYYIRFDLTNVTTHVSLTTGKAGGDDALDSDATNGATGNFAWTDPFTVGGGQTNLNFDLGLGVFNSTRAEVAEVWGEWAGGEGRVGWRTSSEWNTAGFFVYRVDPETGAETLLNERPVASAFEAAGSVYGLADPQALGNGAGVYRLEELELSGGLMDLGTHAVAFAAEPAVAKSARAESKAVRAIRKAAPKAQPKAEGPSSALKVYVKKEGLAGVSLESIAAGMGRPLADVQALAAAGSLALRAQGNPVPTIYDETRGRLVFHGQCASNRYTRDAAYFIEEGEGLAMPRRLPEATAGETRFATTVHFEENRKVLDSPAVPLDDFFYWEYVIAGTSATARVDFPVELTGAAGDVALKVRLMGWTSGTNHLAEFFFNGSPVGSVAFYGQETVEPVLAISAASISNGVNTLTVKGTLQAGTKFSAFVLDWIEASFERDLVPLAGTAHIRAGAAEAVSAAAFAEPLAVALDGDGNPTWIADESGALPAKAWTTAVANERFAVIEADGVPMATPEPAAADAWFLAVTNRIDYLVIASRALAPAAQELADYRAGQGLRVGVAVFEDVCDLMTDGLRTPESIPELLSYAEAYWAEAPWLVVLAGNGSYDYYGTMGAEINHIPAMLIQTAEGLFAADGLLADSGGDDRPDVALGRLPALTTNDLAAMIAKIKAYESGFGQAWQNQLVLAADKTDALAGNFAAANATLAALADGDHPVATIDLNATLIAPARASLSNWFKSGAGIIHYTGHGGAQNWSKSSLLTRNDVAAMNNSNCPPVVAALSCLVGRYEAPAMDSMGELLMKRAGGGAVAVWGPSGLSRNDPATMLGEAFYRAVLQDGSGTLGTAILRAVRGLEDDLFSRDTLAVYNLLGDPALRIAGNTGGQSSARNFAEWRWEGFGPAALVDPANSPTNSDHFFDYAMNGGYSLQAELPEFGYALPEELPAVADGFILRWKRRIQRADVDYRLFLSSDLQTWETNSPDLETVGVEPDADGVMETVRTRINRPASMRVFMGIQAKKK